MKLGVVSWYDLNRSWVKIKKVSRILWCTLLRSRTIVKKNVVLRFELKEASTWWYNTLLDYFEQIHHSCTLFPVERVLFHDARRWGVDCWSGLWWEMDKRTRLDFSQRSGASGLLDRPFFWKEKDPDLCIWMMHAAILLIIYKRPYKVIQ